MNPVNIQLVQSSFEKVEPIADAAAGLFYGKLFELDPSVRSLFPEDLAEQGKKLMKMLGIAVRGLSNLDSLVPAVEELGRRHGTYGVKDADYETVGAALLWTLESGLGEDFTAEVKSAWTEAYTTLSSVMRGAVND